MKPMMECGHAANAKDELGRDVCAICAGSPQSEHIVEPPILEWRTAVCCYCGFKAQSSVDLPFFQHRPDVETDSWYCGCRGFE